MHDTVEVKRSKMKKMKTCTGRSNKCIPNEHQNPWHKGLLVHVSTLTGNTVMARFSNGRCETSVKLTCMDGVKQR